MKNISREIKYQGVPVIEMKAGGYEAMIAPTIGSNLFRLRDNKNKMEILRFHKDAAMKKLAASPAVYGIPSLYLPNRLEHGVLRVSDATYQLPVNEGRFQNQLHGFLHTRAYTVVETAVEGEKAIAKTRYIYDENDEFFQYYPVKFQSDLEFVLDGEGMHYSFTLTNLSDKQMPYGVCNHAAFRAPFTKKGKGKNLRLRVPAVKRCELNWRQLPTGKTFPLTAYDEQYVNGTKLVQKVPIDNDMYLVEKTEVDGKPFYGVVMTDLETGKRVCYEVDETFKFFIMWNDRGTKDYFCPEPMSWMINAPNLDLPAEETGYIELAPGESKTVTERIYTL
jgi:aldose 1-epimerase